MFQTFDIVQAPNVSVTVAEVDARLTPPGLALELHLVRLGPTSLAFWLLEDGTCLRFVEVGRV